MATPLETILGAAESALGVQYRWGGNSLAAGVDCSGLIQQAYLAAGIALPRVSASQMRVGQPVASIEDAQPGDLIGYQTGNRNGSGVEHIAMYLGNGQMIEAYRTGEPVRVTAVRPGAEFRRVLGAIDPTRPAGQVALGANPDRQYTAAAVGAAPAPQVAAAAVTGPPEGGVGDDLPDDATPEQTDAYIREHFPDLAAFMGNAEIHYLLTWAAREDVGDAELQGALRRTDYYRTHGSASRAFDSFLAEASPEDQTRLVGQATDIINNLFSRNGVTLDPAQAGELAKQAIRAGDISLQGFVVNQAGLNKIVAYGLGQSVTEGEDLGGEAAFSSQQIMALARSEYMFPITQREADRWAVDILNGSQTEESIRATLNERAQDRYDWLDLSNGRTVQSATDGIIAAVAGELEVDPDTIDLLDPKWNQFLEATDENTGRRRGRTLGEAVQMARDLPEYEGTAKYQQGGASFLRGLVDFTEGRAA